MPARLGNQAKFLLEWHTFMGSKRVYTERLKRPKQPFTRRSIGLVLRNIPAIGTGLAVGIHSDPMTALCASGLFKIFTTDNPTESISDVTNGMLKMVGPGLTAETILWLTPIIREAIKGIIAQ